jgi:hypothetical protein
MFTCERKTSSYLGEFYTHCIFFWLRDQIYQITKTMLFLKQMNIKKSVFNIFVLCIVVLNTAAD